MINRKEAKGLAHGKLILTGEHIVVYNKPAIAIPFPLQIRAGISQKSGEITVSSKLYNGRLHDLPGEMLGLQVCVNKSLELCHQPNEGIHIEITSDIPEGRGLGSSAASAMAVVRGIFEYFHKFLSDEQLFFLVELAETYAHGKPSGIDMMAVASEEPILYQKPEGVVKNLVSPNPFHIVVADTGQIGDTKKAVEHVNALKVEKPKVFLNVIDEIEEIVKKAQKAILEGNIGLLGALFVANHEKLKELNVSNSMLDHLVEVAIGSGALGAKLTGGGMGGCIIALAMDRKDAKSIAKTLKEQGAKTVWDFSTNSSKVYKLGH